MAACTSESSLAIFNNWRCETRNYEIEFLRKLNVKQGTMRLNF